MQLARDAQRWRGWACKALQVSLLLPSSRLAAVAVSDKVPRDSLGLGISTLYRQQSDGRREQRYRYDGFYLTRLSPWLRWENRLAVARDQRPRSQAVEVHEHVYEVFSGLRLTYPYLFRYGFSAGPLVQWQVTTTEVDTDTSTEERFQTWQLGWQAQLSLDYAVNSNWEIMGLISYQRRPMAGKSDVAFGVSVLLNSSIRKSQAPPPLSPSPPVAPSPLLPAPLPAATQAPKAAGSTPSP